MNVVVHFIDPNDEADEYYPATFSPMDEYARSELQRLYSGKELRHVLGWFAPRNKAALELLKLHKASGSTSHWLVGRKCLEHRRWYKPAIPRVIESEHKWHPVPVVHPAPMDQEVDKFKALPWQVSQQGESWLYIDCNDVQDNETDDLMDEY